jgi:hypothetical protein
VSHRQRLHKIENSGRERQQQKPIPFNGKKSCGELLEMKGNYWITELSRIGRWVIQSIVWWSLDVIDQCMIAKTRCDLAQYQRQICLLRKMKAKTPSS